MSSLSILIVIALVGWFWYSNLQARELASRLAANHCRQDGVQFLDGTAALRKIEFQRNLRGQISLQRTYQFDFTETGEERQQGEIVLLQGRVIRVQLQPAEQIQ